MSGQSTAARPPSSDTAAARAIEGGARLLAAAAGLGVAFMALATVYDVGMRYLLDSPTSWATEISTYVLAATIFFGAAHAHLLGRHVRLDILPAALPEARRRGLLSVAAWIGFLVVALTAWRMALQVEYDLRNGSRLFSLLLTPAWIPKTPVAIGLFGLAAALLVEIERLADRASRWRRLAPYVIFGAAVAPALALMGASPPQVAGTRFDAGSVAILAGVLAAAFASGGARVGGAVALACLGGIAATAWAGGAGREAASAVLCAILLVALLAGVRIALALSLVGVATVYFLTPAPFPATLAERAWSSVDSFALTAVPMFVLMGAILERSGLSGQLFTVLAGLLSRFPGGLAHAGIAGCAVFSAVSGSSVATAATMGGVACPEMTRRGYDPRLAYGSIAAGGTLGILIPPSVPLIVYGITVGAPITALFLAGILPGLMLTALFMAAIVIWALLRPAAAPAVAKGTAPAGRAAWIDTVVVVGLIALVIASLYLGVATPSETGAVAAVAAALACLARGRLRWAMLRAAFAETVAVTSFVFLLIVGASTMAYGFDLLRVAERVMEAAATAELGRWTVLAAVLGVYLILGMFLDSISMMVLTLPVVFPLAMSYGFDPIWFGIVVVIVAEIGLITPPVGMNLFVLQGVGDGAGLRTLAAGAAPFLAMMLLAIALLCAEPGLALRLGQGG